MSKIADKSGEMGCIVAEMSAIVDKSGQMVRERGSRTRVCVSRGGATSKDGSGRG